MIKIVRLLIALMVIGVGFFTGCINTSDETSDELSDDEWNFLLYATDVCCDLSPLTEDNLYYAFYKVDEYRQGINSFKISDRCIGVRSGITLALDSIEKAYLVKGSEHSINMMLANDFLDIALDEIKDIADYK